MSIGYRIKEARNRLGLTQVELAETIGVTKGAIANYENEISTPKIDLLFKLFKALKCDANYLYQDDMNLLDSEFKITFSEEEHILKYRKLDVHGKEIIDCIINIELKRLKNEEDKKEVQTNIDETPKSDKPQQTRMYVADRNGNSGYVDLPPEGEEARQKLLKEKFPELLNPNNEELPEF